MLGTASNESITLTALTLAFAVFLVAGIWITPLLYLAVAYFLCLWGCVALGPRMWDNKVGKWALILGITRRIGEGERLVRAGDWKGWSFDFMLGTSLQGKMLGIVGGGRIGRRGRGGRRLRRYGRAFAHVI